MSMLMTNFDAIIKKCMNRLAWEFDVKTLKKCEHNDILQLNVYWGPNCELPGQFVLKQPSNHMRNFVAMHNNECNFYELKRDCGWSFAPAHYGMERISSWRDKGMFLFEDLTAEFSALDFAEGMTLQQCVRVIDALSKIHASCIVEHEIMDEFTADVPADEIHYESLTFLQKHYPDLFPHPFDPLIEAARKVTTFDVPEVLVHGDMGYRNIFYPLVDRKDDNKENYMDSPIFDKFEDLKSSTRVAIIDWAKVRRGLFTEDIADLVASNLPANVRRKYTALILKHYYAQLVKHAKAYDAEVPITLTDVIRAYDAIYPVFALKTAHRVATFIKEDNSTRRNVLDKATRKKLAHRASAALMDVRLT